MVKVYQADVPSWAEDIWHRSLQPIRADGRAHAKKHRPWSQVNPPYGDPSGEQLEVREAFKRSCECFRMQPYSGGESDPALGPANRSAWWNLAVPSGLWYYDYFIQQTWPHLFGKVMPAWCIAPGALTATAASSYYEGTVDRPKGTAWWEIYSAWKNQYWNVGVPPWQYGLVVEAYNHRRPVGANTRMTGRIYGAAYGIDFHTLPAKRYAFIQLTLMRTLGPGADARSPFSLRCSIINSAWDWLVRYWGTAWPTLKVYTPTDAGEAPSTQRHLLMIPGSLVDQEKPTIIGFSPEGGWFSPEAMMFDVWDTGQEEDVFFRYWYNITVEKAGWTDVGEEY